MATKTSSHGAVLTTVQTKQALAATRVQVTLALAFTAPDSDTGATFNPDRAF